MSKLPQDELLSAYLDGELNAQRKADVEKLLAEDPSAQATLDSLRAASSAVKGLPVFKLDEDLTDDVLKIAERRMLADAPPLTTSKSAGAKTGDKTAVEPTWRTVARRFLTPRAIAWSTAVALVAIIITYNNREEDKPGPRGEIAMEMKHDRREGDERAIRGRGEFRAAPSLEAAAIEADSSPAESAPAAAIAKKEHKASERLGETIAKKGMPAPSAAEPPATKSRYGGRLYTDFDESVLKPATKKALKKTKRESLADVAKKPDAERLDTNRHLATKGGPVETKQQDMLDMGMGGGMGGGMGVGGRGFMGGGMGRRGMGKGGPTPLAVKDNEGRIRQKSGVNARSGKSWTDGKTAKLGLASAGESQIVTVRCQVDSRPAARKALRQILLTQKLFVEKRPTVLSQSKGLQKDQAEQSDSKMELGVAVRRERDEDAPADIAGTVKNQPAAPMPLARQVETRAARRLRQKPAEPDSISFEATPAQLEQVLAEIHKQSNVFGKYSIDSGPMDTKLGTLGQTALGYGFVKSSPATQQREPAGDRLNAQLVLPPTAMQQSAPAPMGQGQQAQTAPPPAQRNMPHDFDRTINFKVVFLMQPDVSKAAASVKAKEAKQ